MGKWKNIILGEKMPDKDDPKYREKYEKDVAAGRRFARATKLDLLAARIQSFAEKHRRLFLVIVFGIILFCFGLNVSRVARAYRLHREAPGAVRTQEEVLKEKINENANTITSIPQNDGTDKEN